MLVLVDPIFNTKGRGYYFQGVPGSNCKLAYFMWLLYVLCYHDCGCRLGGIYGTSCSMVTAEAQGVQAR